MRRAALAVVVLWGCRGSPVDSTGPQPARVRCVLLVGKSVSDTRTVRGTVAPEPDRDAIVSSQVPGRLLRVLVREGGQVERGATLAEVEALPMRDALRQAEAELSQAVANQKAAGAAATRQDHLFERGISARQSAESARAAAAQADASVEIARARVDSARRNVGRTLVRSPMAGVVLRVLRRPGELVDGTSSTPILEVADTATLELAGSAAPADLVLLRAGQHAEIAFDALPGRRFEGVVRTVSPSIDRATGVGSVRLTLSPGAVRPPLGLLGQAEIATGAPRTALFAPAPAVRSGGGALHEILTCAGGRSRVVQVATGRRLDGLVEVSGNVDARTRVVADEVSGLEDGARIEEKP